MNRAQAGPSGRWSLFAAIAAVATVGLLAAMLCHEPVVARGRTASGIPVTLYGVTRGPDNICPRGPLSIRMLPVDWNHVACMDNPGTLGLWFAYPARQTELRTWIEDEHGCRFLNARQSGFSGLNGDPMGEFRAFEVYPRRQGPWTACCCVERLGAPIAPTPERADIVRFALRNDDPASYPVWKAAPYPARVKSGKWEFVLRGLRKEPLDDGGFEWVADIVCLERGRRSERCRVTKITVSDSTGNRDSAAGYWSCDGGVRVPGLCNREAAWELEFTPLDIQASLGSGSSLHPLPPLTARGLRRELALNIPDRQIVQMITLISGRTTRETGPSGGLGEVALRIDSSQSLQATLLDAATGKRVPNSTPVLISAQHQLAEFTFILDKGNRPYRFALALSPVRTVRFRVRPQAD